MVFTSWNLVATEKCVGLRLRLLAKDLEQGAGLREEIYMYSDYSGAPLLWTPWGPGEVSCIEKCTNFRGKFIIF